MIPLNDAFFEDEIREGFYIPAEIKQAWGAEIEVLNEIERVCKKHALKYFAAWGTLLGAVRHAGIIPWDDDFDILMLRKDYEKFMEVYKDEMPEGFDVITFKNNPDHIQFITNVVGKRRICFEQEHLERFHGFPYICGIDIFLMDNMSSDAVEEKNRMKIADLVLKIADSIYGGTISGRDVDDSLRQIEKWCGVRVPAGLKGVELRIFLYTVVEKWISKVEDSKAIEITQVIPWGVNGRDYIFNKKYYEQVYEIPFEGGSIMTTPYYMEQLNKSYGDFMKIYKDAGGHNYPFFDKQKEDLQKVLDFDMPGYRFTEEMLQEIQKCSANLNADGADRERANDLSDSYRYKTLGVTDILIELCDNIPSISKSHTEVNDSLLEILGNMQQASIELGTYIERIKGEGYITVSRLEEICELVFEYSNNPSDILYEKIAKTAKAVREDIETRKEVVFIPFKAKYWESFKAEYDKCMADENVDVYVLPVPYYYKKYDGTLRDMQFDIEAYPDELPLVKYDKFDLSEHMPDVIYIQNPYDEFNAAMSVPVGFYSSRLRKYTNQLIYIPWFKTAEFDQSDARAYKNMRYYVQVPGVVNSDIVFVQSENIRKLYIDKLCELAGEDSRAIWEEKVCAVNTDGDQERQDADTCGNDKCRNIIYANNFSDVLLNAYTAIDKIRNVMEVFAKAAEKGSYKITWMIQKEFERELKIIDSDLRDEFYRIVDEYSDKNWCVIIDMPKRDEIEKLVEECDGYYGDAGVVAHYCRNAGLPVMIQNLK